ncbi:hypothetical protein WQ3_02716 [Enterococcus faecalis EnGen0338]|nr:hypothetical protein WQ3_02716 [Enterococcus faecalis EnGen0338]
MAFLLLHNYTDFILKLSINLIYTIDKLKILFGEQNYEKKSTITYL